MNIAPEQWGKDVAAELSAARAEIERLRDDRWKHGAECMRQAILSQLPGGQICDPQWVADMVRAIHVPGLSEQKASKADEAF